MDKSERTEFVKEIVESYMEARDYDNEHLFDDRMAWLRNIFDKGWSEFPDEYDYDTQVWSIGYMMAQIERYGGVVIKTQRYGMIPSNTILNETPFDKWSK